MVEKQASSEIAGKSMNKSEIAEKAAREIHDRFVGGCVPEKCDVVIDISAIVERAIAESQAPQWISVEEKLPPRNIDVIVAVDADGDSPRESAVDHMTGAGWYHHLEKYVTHWMHLPERELGDGEPSSGLPLKNCIEPECDEIGTHLDHSPLTPFGESQLCQTPGVSNDPAPKYSDYAEAIAYHDALAKWVLRNFESGQMSAGRLACVFDCVEFATKQRESGAAQEVSPPSPELITKANDLLRRLNKEVFNDAVDMYKLPEAVGWVIDFAKENGGDTRELKAALRESAYLMSDKGFDELDVEEWDHRAKAIRDLAELLG